MRIYGWKTILCLLWDYDNLYFRAPLCEILQGLKKFEKRGGHPELDQYESIVNQWTLAQKVLGLVKVFGRAHQTRRKEREHMNEPKKTANQIPRHRQKTMSLMKKNSFGRAHPTLRKIRGHMNEPNMTG